MQVCAEKQASDEEILAVCNRDNPAGTENGWSTVCRSTEPDPNWGNRKPVQCADHPERLHLLVVC
jgi:hypothetical protein